MPENPNEVRPSPAPPARLDEIDRTLSALLAEDATRSYADLGRLVGLSPASTHERVRRLRQSGVIRGTVAMLDAAKVGRPLLAFVHVDTIGWGKGPEMQALAALPEVEEMHGVTGDACVLIKVRTQDPASLEAFLARLYRVEGVRATRSYVVLSTVVERGPRPG